MAASLAALGLPGTWHGVTGHAISGAWFVSVPIFTVGLVGFLFASDARRPSGLLKYWLGATVVFAAANCFDVLRHQGRDAVPWGAVVVGNSILDAILVAIVVAIGYGAGRFGRRLARRGPQP